MTAEWEQEPRPRDTAIEPWPDWNIRDIPALAKYVSVEALDEIGMDTPPRFVGSNAADQDGRFIARAVYESIRNLRLTYSHQPWRRESSGTEAIPKQRVRYPAWVRRDACGTCLDLAVLYASALMKAQIRPFIAIMYGTQFNSGHVQGEQAGHAFVVADLSKPLTVQDRLSKLPDSLVEATPGELRVLTPSREWPAHLLPIDPMRVTANFPQYDGTLSGAPQEFGKAVAGAAALVDASLESLRLCDVAGAQWTTVRPLGRPADSATPAIWTRLPEMPTPTQYPSRRSEHDKVMTARGRIVIHGKQGFGKSTLAYERAREADSGYGWFLNAADQSALQSELAQAEINQRARSYTGLEKLDRVPFSQAATARLEMSDAPWVLVVDNANGDPGPILSQLPRAPKGNQTIIVTTTNPAWLNVWPDATPATLEELSDRDMTGIPAELQSRVGGSPLFYEAARSAIESGVQVPVIPESDAALVWQLGREFLAAEPAALDLAHLVAWAPAVPLPVDRFTAFCGDRGPVLGRLLEQAGLARLLTRPTPSVLMHRLIAARIRQDLRPILVPGHEVLPAPVALLAADAGQRLMIDHGDDESFEQIEDYLRADPPAGITPRSWALAVYGVARAGEIRGRSAVSSGLFEQAIGHLDSELDISLLSECWNGRARYMKDHPPRENRKAALAEALAWAEQAESLARQAAKRSHDDLDRAQASQAQAWDLIRAERARAMQALIMKAQARDIADAEESKALLDRSLRMLEESETERAARLKELGIRDSPDIDRAKFNLGGPCIDIAKLSQGAEAERHLRRALEVYEQVKRIRVERHGQGIAMPSIAACDFGLALAYYYGALLEVDPLRPGGAAFMPVSPESRMSLLRRATASAWNALRDRTVLAPDGSDNEDALKSDDLMIKIIEVRKLVTAQYAKRGSQLTGQNVKDALAAAETGARLEAQRLGRIIGDSDGLSE